MGRCPLAVAVFLTTMSSAGMATTYTGILSYGLGLEASGDWGRTGTTFEWAVAAPTATNSKWQYAYTFTAGPEATHGISNLSLEVSSDLENDDIVVISPAAGYTKDVFDGEQGKWANKKDEGGLPDSMHAVKFDLNPGTLTSWSVIIESSRQPMWGDFFVKNGNGADDDDDAPTPTRAYNAGFTDNDSDPTVALKNVNNDFSHILVPDTSDGPTPPSPVIPEPATSLLFGLGMGGLMVHRRRKI